MTSINVEDDFQFIKKEKHNFSIYSQANNKQFEQKLGYR